MQRASTGFIPIGISTTRNARFLTSGKGFLARTTKAGQHLNNNSGNYVQQQLELEKPLKFNPPSHPASTVLKRSPPRHYGAPSSATQLRTQSLKHYPGLSPPPGSFGYWFWYHPQIHGLIAILVLLSLACYTFTHRFFELSPYAEMMPSASDFWHDPVDSMWTALKAFGMHIDGNTATALETKALYSEDIDKRRRYRIIHNEEDRTLFHALLPAAWIKQDNSYLLHNIEDYLTSASKKSTITGSNKQSEPFK